MKLRTVGSEFVTICYIKCHLGHETEAGGCRRQLNLCSDQAEGTIEKEQRDKNMENAKWSKPGKQSGYKEGKTPQRTRMNGLFKCTELILEKQTTGVVVFM